MIYFLLVDRFANGDPTNDLDVNPADPQAFHGGDLAGLSRHVDELAALGVDTLWLGPIAKMRDTPFYGFGAYHGYWTEDLDRLEPRFGTEQDLGRLVDALHHRKIGLALDVVYNHLAPDHAWVTTRPDWFHHFGPIEHWDDAEEVRTHDVHGLPDLDQSNPDVYSWLRDASFDWLRRAHPVAFRLDAVRHLDPAFVSRIGADVRSHAPGSFQLWGEVFDGNVKTVLDARQADHLDTVFDFPLHYALLDVVCNDKPAAAIPAVIDRTASLPPDAWITFLDNHDTARITTACHEDAARVDLALKLLFALRGRPMITWGTEWSQPGTAEPDVRADMRWVARTPEEDAAHRSRTELIRSLALQRKTTAALNRGTSRTIGLGPDWFVIERRSGEEVRWVTYNGGGDPIPFPPFTLAPRSVSVEKPGVADAPKVKAGWTKISLAGVPPLVEGDLVHLVGSTAGLGDWDPKSAPVVPGKVRFGADAELYKLAITHADGTVSWAPGGNQWSLGAAKEREVRWE